MKRMSVALTLLALAFLITACGGRGAEALTPPNSPPPATVAPQGAVALQTTASPQATANATSAPSATMTETATATPTATATVTPSATATVTPTETPRPTPTPTAALAIVTMRQQTYPGSAIVIEQTLQPGSNYQRYLASYRSDELKIYALLTVPNGDPPATGWPAIIFNHGYIPPAQYRTTERYVAYVDAFARSGYIVFRPDYRGHGSSEGEALGGYGAPDYTVDVLNAAVSVRQYTATDPDRIGMWGHSMGGHLTLRAMVTTDFIKAGVIWAGVVATYPDMMTKWRRPASAPPLNIPERARRWRQELLDTYGTPEENPAFWTSISPSEFVADLSGPLQLHHGTADVEVPLAFTQDLYARVQAAGIPVEYYEYPGDNHNLSKNLTLALNRSVAFFDRYLK